jgi:hypothetical protein
MRVRAFVGRADQAAFVSDPCNLSVRAGTTQRGPSEFRPLGGYAPECHRRNGSVATLGRKGSCGNWTVRKILKWSIPIWK